MNARDEYEISPGHLALLNRWANADPCRKAVNLLILRMLEEKVPHLTIMADGSATKIRAGPGLSNLEATEWGALPWNLERIWKRLTFMSNPPLPWWHDLPFWYWLSFHITERIDRWFWHPPLQHEGLVEFIFSDKSFWVSFKSVQSDRLELRYSESMPKNEVNRL